MKIQDASQIIRSLANGVDPLSSERLGEHSVYQNAEVTRALFIALGALEKLAQRERRAESQPTNAGKGWSTDNDVELLSAFDRHESLADLARHFGRSLPAVRARLVRLGRIDEGSWSSRED